MGHLYRLRAFFAAGGSMPGLRLAQRHAARITRAGRGSSDTRRKGAR
jgi:hypothetical protein